MGLDVYVGPLTRYYAGDWETIVQQVARQQGLQVQIVRPNQPQRGLFHRLRDRLFPRSAGPTAAYRAVSSWRRVLQKQSRIEAFAWNEVPEYEYFTDKPTWDCYGALLLWACYAHLPHAKHASVVGEWANDPAYQTLRCLPEHPYEHLLEDTEFWFPIEFSRPFRTTTILGESVSVGSSIGLLRELDRLNRHTWSASAEEIAQWRSNGADIGESLEPSARFAFGIFYELAQLAVQHRLPMKLDY